MKILVTGGSGLVGYGIKQLDVPNDQFIYLSSQDCDLTNYEEILTTFKKIKPDSIIHLAACVGGLYKNMNQKVDMYEKNTLINFNVLKCAQICNIKKVVSCLSTCIFPDKSNYPINENMLHDGAPHDSNYAYAYSKRMIEIQSRVYNEQYGTNFVCVIPTNIYGKNDNFSLKDGHVIPALIHKCYIAKQKNKPFIVCGTGSPLRQFIYSKDLAQLIWWTLKNYNENKPIILSVSENEEVSIKDVATMIAQEFDYLHNMTFDTSFSDGQYKKTADNSKLLSLYPNVSFTPIQQGISYTVKWFINNYDKVRK
tara:strand:- start:699 stop:1628 length:930 start_codon:yes stop_codon:yes gene_type:complete